MDFEIDLDSECVWLDDAWLNREDLVRKIRSMMDSQNFEIARPSQALEALTKSLANARLLALRISPELSDALNVAAQSHGRPVGALAREAIASWLAAAPAPAPGIAPVATAAASSAPTQPGLIALTDAAPAETITEVEATMISSDEPPSSLTTEPVTAEEAANAVTLTPKRKDGEKEVDKRWFDK